MLAYVKSREVLCSILLQLGLAVFLAHGYDFRVNYVAGRNVVLGRSPYVGGVVEGVLAEGYGSHVQGLGETPLWALYTGLAYSLSSGNLFFFNTLLKIPVIAANIFLSYLVMKRGGDRFFFLYNPYLLLVSSVWGKPDNIAVLLALTAVGCGWGPLSAAASLMVKPLALAIAPSFIALWRRSRDRILYWLASSAVMFFTPFLLLGWPLENVVYGVFNWFKPAGGISVFNFVEAVYGVSTLPQWLEPLSYLSAASLAIVLLLAVKHPPADADDVLRLGLVSASLFLSLRPWVSEQNLLIIHSLFLLVCGRLPSRLLWVVPLIFAAVNLAIPQQLYLLRPSIVEELTILNHPARYWLKFATSIAWLTVLWNILIRKRLWKWWV
ncbi:MAG: hypothetical protein QW470_07250 [Candidatus Caldarchaeum sp.]